MGVKKVVNTATPYHASELSDMDYDQTELSLYTAHLNRPVHKAVREDHHKWAWSPVTFGPTSTPPGGVAAVASEVQGPGTAGYAATTQSYVVTAINAGGSESRASAVVSAVSDLSLKGNKVNVSWTAVAGASYVVYKSNNGVFGYIGRTDDTTFSDNNIIPDLTNTPPQGTNYFTGEGNYPSTIAFYGQRLVLARTINKPNGLWASQVDDPENFDAAVPTKPDDALSRAFRGRRANVVQQLLSTTALLVFTSARIFSIETLDATQFEHKGQGTRGASRLKPIEIDEIAFFQPLQGASIRSLGYSFEIEGYQTNDITFFSSHLFRDDAVRAWAYQAEPFSVVWVVMWSGRLLAFTWQREQQVWGWTVCETDGQVEDVTVITEQGYDRVYLTVVRDLEGAQRRCYERMALPHSADISDACPLDCARSFEFEEPQTRITGLQHLEGRTVTAYAEGYEYPGLVVAGGEVDLPVAHNKVSVGIPYTGEVELLPLALATAQGSEHTATLNFQRAIIRTVDTKGLEASGSGGQWEALPDREGDEPFGWVPDVREQDFEAPIDGSWGRGSTVTIRQAHALPWHITGVFLQPAYARD